MSNIILKNTEVFADMEGSIVDVGLTSGVVAII